MAKNTTDYDDLALIMAAIISCIAILGLVLFLKSGMTGNFFKANEDAMLKIAQPTYKGTPEFYCQEGAFALWTRQAVDAVLRLDYGCTVSEVNKEVTCCYPPKD